MKRPLTLDDIRNSAVYELNKHLFDKPAPAKEKKRHKFGASRTEVGGETFDSKREAKRYAELRILQKAGKIGMLARQVDYELNAGGSHSLVYRADFVYIEVETGRTIVEDAKGMLTREYKKKKRLMKQIYGIEIQEV
ncbi:MAG TPA: DUF1064 domain-containing protein [Flavitalea sp.]|nr:DUF1064 domain-containing protein [Flavitalea sp.]